MSANVGSLVSGFMFGAALTISGVASPRVIRDQFKLSDYHMLVTFLTASASSAAILLLYNSRTTDKKIPVRPVQRQTGFMGKFDSHILGGAMVGLGMSLTGACPGTVLVQATAGIGHSRFVALSSLFAGVIFAKWKRSRKAVPADQQRRESVMSATGWSVHKAVLIYTSAILVVIPTVLSLASRSGAPVHPITGGLLIGLSQFASLILAGKAIGVSGAYGDAGEAFWNVVGGVSVKGLEHSIAFALALVVGAKITMLSLPGTLETLVPLKNQSILVALMGGFLLTFGAKLAGGCTSGHGISGMAGMSLSSFVTVAAMFGTGILSAFPFM